MMEWILGKSRMRKLVPLLVLGPVSSQLEKRWRSVSIEGLFTVESWKEEMGSGVLMPSVDDSCSWINILLIDVSFSTFINIKVKQN